MKKPYLIKKVKKPDSGMESQYMVYLSESHMAFIFNHEYEQTHAPKGFKCEMHIIDIDFLSVLKSNFYHEWVDETIKRTGEDARTREIDIVALEAVEYVKQNKPNGLHYARIEKYFVQEKVPKAEIRVNKFDQARWKSQATAYFRDDKKGTDGKTSN